jgi:hypothetical protein
MVGCLKIIEMLLDTHAGINAVMTVGNVKQIAFLIETEDQGTVRRRRCHGPSSGLDRS